MNWQDYEQLTAYIYEQISAISNATVVAHGNNCRIIGKSGTTHQIDVLVKSTLGPHSILTAIECKSGQSRKVGVDVIRKLRTTVEDTYISKTVVVSYMGFTAPAIDLARHYGISLVKMSEPEDSDFKDRIREVLLVIDLIIPEIYDFELIQENIEGTRCELTNISLNDLLVAEPGFCRRSLSELLNFELKNCKDHKIERRFTQGSTLFVPHLEQSTKVDGFKCKVRYSTLTKTSNVRLEDHIYMYMHFLFEEKFYSIDHNQRLIMECK